MHMNATKWVLAKLKQHFRVSDDHELLNVMHIDTFDMRGLDLHGGVMPHYVGDKHSFLDTSWSGDIMKLWNIDEKEIEGNAGFSYVVEDFPLAQANDFDSIRNFNWPQADWFSYKDLDMQLAKWSDKAIIATGASFFQHATFVRGMDILLLDMLIDVETAGYIFDQVFDFYYEFFARIMEKAGHLIDLLAFADDLASQQSLLFGPELFEQYFAAKIRKMADLVHKYGVKLLLHTDGNVSELIPRFIELGVDILDPIQPEADNMDAKVLKKMYGSELCFRGGVSAQNTLTYGSKQEVKDETRRLLDVMMPGGGYILAPGHPVLQDDIPVENIITMYQTGLEYS
ncbi:MAG: hypothetical protein MI975_04570 [Cytophagales bacterium]|nr:hypothetical protein [Cytophagales bacterium]